MDKIGGNMNITDPISISDALACINDKIENSDSDNILSGIRVLDEITDGWAPGELCILGAATAMGKTSFVLSCITNIVSRGLPVALFSAPDTMNENFVARVVSALKDEDMPKTKAERRKLLEGARLQDVPLYTCHNSRMTLAYIRDNLETLVKERGIRCVFIETIQSIFVSENKGNTKEGMERICHELRCMAREFNLPFIVTSELNRSPENRVGAWGKIPRMSDLRSSYAIEQEADSVYLFYRPEFYHIFEDEEANDLNEIGEVTIAKNNYGSCGKVRVRFNHSTCRIEDISASNERAKLKIQDMMNNNDSYKLLKEKLGLDIVE